MNKAQDVIMLLGYLNLIGIIWYMVLISERNIGVIISSFVIVFVLTLVWAGALGERKR